MWSSQSNGLETGLPKKENVGLSQGTLRNAGENMCDVKMMEQTDDAWVDDNDSNSDTSLYPDAATNDQQSSDWIDPYSSFLMESRVNEDEKNLSNFVFPYMGTRLVPSNKTQTLPAFRLPHSKCRVLRLSVENGVQATGAELLKALQKEMLHNQQKSNSISTETDTTLPTQMNVKGQTLYMEYFPPHGDELYFGSHGQDIQWIGDRCLGTVCISPLDDKACATTSTMPEAQPDKNVIKPTWESLYSFRSWHHPALDGTPGKQGCKALRDKRKKNRKSR